MKKETVYRCRNIYTENGKIDGSITVKDGKIIEQGRHKDLMRMKGYYYNLYTRQYAEETTRSLS